MNRPIDPVELAHLVSNNELRFELEWVACSLREEYMAETGNRHCHHYQEFHERPHEVSDGYVAWRIPILKWRADTVRLRRLDTGESFLWIAGEVEMAKGDVFVPHIDFTEPWDGQEWEQPEI